MILFDPTPIIPKHLRVEFIVLRFLMLLLFLGAGSFFAFKTIFPEQRFFFSFENPDTAKNTLEDPTGLLEKESLKKGRIPKNDTLKTYAGTVGSFSEAHVSIVLEKDSYIPEKDLTLSLRKSYRSFFFPEGDLASALPKERAFVVDGTPYFFSDGALSPFLSDQAALSRFPKEKILQASPDLLKLFPPIENQTGFRPGSLLSDAEGVYTIGGDGKAHPIGSTEVFESLGFSWKDVKPVNSEEISFHKRGKIFLFDAEQPDGTIFYDVAKKQYFLISTKERRLIDNKDLVESLKKITTPIEVSSIEAEKKSSCILQKKTLSLSPTYFCDISISKLQASSGGSFEITLENGDYLHIAELSITFGTNFNKENLSLFIRQIKERFDAIYGGKK